MAEDELQLHGVDRRFYEENLAPWLPARILDCHVHVGLGDGAKPISPERYKSMWSLEVGCHQSWRQLRQTYRALFPEQEVSALAFANVYYEIDTDRENDYVLAGILDEANRAQGLYVTRPTTQVADIAHALSKGFIGIKPYPDLFDGVSMEVSIFDFAPREHLEIVNELGGVMMLHLPRAGRLGDPDNIREVIEISEAYPHIRLIVAHIGRAYCLPTAKRGLPALAHYPGIHFDISANVNQDVIEYALEIVGPDRILYGTDIPVMLMRGVREHVGERYIDFTDGPYSWNTNRKSPDEESSYTFYVYEQIRALIQAARRLGYSKDLIEQVMYTNGTRLFGKPVSLQTSPSAVPSARTG